MKKITGFIFTVFIFSCSVLHAQTGIGTITPSTRAMLDITSSNKGVLIPRIDFNNRPTGSVESGMLIYVTANGPAGDNRFYYFNGTQWEAEKNTDDDQTLSLSSDTLRISQGNYVLLSNLYAQLGYTHCGTAYVQLASDVQNCGACGNTCNFINAAGFCANSSCYIGNCNSGFGNCDNNTANGCETNLTNNVSNCGACGNVCPTSAANVSSATCAGSTCGIVCNAGFLNCDANNGNGCEVNSFTDVNNCGACGNVCQSHNNAAANCTGAACSFICNAGFANCDANPVNGCEVNTNSDLNNCGNCGNVCSVANGIPACTAGLCSVFSCNAGFANCDGLTANGCEINTNTSVNNCGFCGHVCSIANGIAACTAGACTVSACNAGFGNCDNNPANGCEVNMNTDVNNCGSCGHVCAAVANSGSVGCSAASCFIATCIAGFANCDGVYSNGCEINTQTSFSNCGSCGHACAAGQTCTGGTCH